MAKANLQLVIHPDYQAKRTLFESLIASPAHYLKQGGSCTVWADNNWVVKRYNQKNKLIFIKQNLGLGRAKKVYKQTQILIDHHIAAPPTVAYGFSKHFGFKTCEYIISHHQQGRLLFDLLMDTATAATDKTAAIDWALACIKQLWQSGWTHGDLKAQNIIIADKAYLIDLDSLAKNNDNQQDKLRFLRNFSDYPALAPFYDKVATTLEVNT